MREREPLEGVIFDLDGTLVDSVPLSLSILNGMLADRGAARRISYAEALPHASAGGLALVSGLLGADSIDAQADLAIFRQRYIATATPRDSVYPGIAELLQDLVRAGLKLAVCSNKPQHLCEKTLTELDLADFFAAVVGSSDAMPAKPAPDMLDETLRRIDLPASRCVMVGDSEVDLALARSRSMDCFFVTYGYGDADENVPAAHLLSDAASLREALFARRSPQPLAATTAVARSSILSFEA